MTNTTNTPKTQTRGNCQCCGRDQAALSKGTMSKHGYTVKGGWFSGVCTGQHYAPMQIERTRTDEIIAQVRLDVAAILRTVANLESGEMNPRIIRRTYDAAIRDYVETEVAYADAPAYEQRDARKAAIWKLTQRAKAGTDFCEQLGAIADRVHGTPLITVTVEAGPAPILPGERRMLPAGKVAYVRYVDKGRVEWSFEQVGVDGKRRSGWTGTQAWRKYPVAEAAVAA